MGRGLFKSLFKSKMEEIKSSSDITSITFTVNGKSEGIEVKIAENLSKLKGKVEVDRNKVIVRKNEESIETKQEQEPKITIEESKASILKEKEQEIIENFKNLTNMEVGNLLYRASENGFTAKDFHSKCDGKSNTVVIIKVKGGDIIGGYTSVKWETPKDGSFSGIKSTEDFAVKLFSLTKNKVYNLKDRKKAYIYMDKDFGPVFGSENGSILEISGENDDMNKFAKTYTVTTNNGESTKNESDIFENLNNDFETFLGIGKDDIYGNEIRFEIDDYEVYEV